MKYVMPLIALICSATISAQTLSGSIPDDGVLGVANPPGDIQLSAMSDDFKVVNGETIDVAAPGVLGNDTGDELVSVLYQPAPDEDPDYQPVGALTLFKDGGIHYEPQPGFAGVDTFIYYTIDANGNVAKAAINFYCFDDGTAAPVFAANQDEFKALSSETLEMPAPGVLGNDIGEGLTAVLMDPKAIGDEVPPAGTLTLNSDGSFSYVPVSGFAGVDTFYFIVSDMKGNSAKCTVSFYCYTAGSGILAAEPLAMGEPAGEEAGSCTAGAGAAPWLLLPMIGLALMRMRRARA